MNQLTRNSYASKAVDWSYMEQGGGRGVSREGYVLNGGDVVESLPC